MNVVYLLLIFVIIMSPIVIQKGRLKVILNDLNDPIFIILSILVSVYVIYVLNYYDTTDKLRHSTLQGLIAFIIAYLAHLDLPYGAFILTFMVVYYLTDDNIYMYK